MHPGYLSVPVIYDAAALEMPAELFVGAMPVEAAQTQTAGASALYRCRLLVKLVSKRGQ
jgi:hypothetical protein